MNKIMQLFVRQVSIEHLYLPAIVLSAGYSGEQEQQRH